MLIKAAAFTVINFVAINQANQEEFTRDIYRVNVQDNTFDSIKTPSSQIKIIGRSISPTLISGLGIFETPKTNPIDLAFKETRINSQEGNKVLAIAKGILAEMSSPVASETAEVINDPDENVAYLNIRLHINTSFEEALEIDSQLTRSLLSRVGKLPERLTFAVYGLG